jgi:hypothetical protein
MAQILNMLDNPVEWVLARKDQRVFALLGKATSLGLAPFGRDDIGRSWAVTSEYGSIRLERMTGDEEITGLELFLPTALNYDYGIAGVSASPELIRAVFGLLPSELEQLATALRRGSFPILGFSPGDMKCCLTNSVIPGYWPHIVVSNLALYGNVVSVEAFVRVLVSSLPQGHLASRFPALQTVLRQVMKVSIARPQGIPYNTEILRLAPAEVMVK